ncbi:hypothetical protein Ocin01_19554 [Orchesella cincta]|uniref:Uncharacterized protein n=1 Tax=Orchesella cincta TaxID=48709 RepID=A0A1D2M2D4_ORCCI|nr:hypothetical protein Ocin01_19554 [Orchesella cincta]
MPSKSHEANSSRFMEDSNWSELQPVEGDYSTFSRKEFDNFKKKADDLFTKNFRADLLNPEDPPHLYEWRRNNNNKALFDMLLAWDRLDEVFEELRCYHFMSYEQLRPVTLKMAKEDLKNCFSTGVQFAWAAVCECHLS